jgi:hypothetical protein
VGGLNGHPPQRGGLVGKRLTPEVKKQRAEQRARSEGPLCNDQVRQINATTSKIQPLEILEAIDEQAKAAGQTE